MVIVYLLDIHHGFGFSAGAIDYFLNFGIAQKPVLLFLIGIIFAIIYFFVFVIVIKVFDLKTPGREDDEDDSNDEVTHESNDYTAMAAQFVDALGGKENIEHVDNCATRLRLTLGNTDNIDEKKLKQHGARGTIRVNNKNYQIIVGTNVEFVAEELKRIVHRD